MTGIQRALLVQQTLEVLVDAGGPITAAEVVAEIEQRVTLTERELSRNESGFRRFDTAVRFGSGWMASIGWIKKAPAGWSITEEGRRALETIPPDQLYRELSRRYREARRAKQAATEIGDPRWQVVRDAIAAVPSGSWTTYGDIAAVAGLPARSIGTYLAKENPAGAHRVLTKDGTLADDVPADHASEMRAWLHSEGVDFDPSGRAAPEQRVTAEDLRDFVGVPAAGKRAWLVRGSAVSGVNVVRQWLDDGLVSVAAAHLRPIEPGTTLEDMRAAVETDYAHLSYNQRKAKLAELHAFLNRMAPGDAVVTTAEGKAYVGHLAGEAEWQPGDQLLTVRRPVEWQPGGVDFADWPEPLAARLRSSATVVDLTEVVDAVESLVGAGPGAAETKPLPVVEATLPDLPAAVADRLLVGKEWLGDFVDLLRSRRQVILHAPPGTGKTYLALEVAGVLTDPANVTLVQFHPAYSYEDFFEGYRPTAVDDSGRVGFALTPGPFRKIVDRAREDPGRPYVLVVDEINRANLAKVFGELYFLLEYRERSIDLMYASGDEGRDFTLPKNVYVVGTMNTADRSIALVDAAMRRRFAFLSLHPDDPHVRGVLRAWLTQREYPTVAADLLDALNARIPDRDFKVGPSYLMRPDAATDEGLARIWRTGILPLLEELHYGDGVDVPKRYGLRALRAVLDQAVVPGETAGAADEREPAGADEG